MAAPTRSWLTGLAVAGLGIALSSPLPVRAQEARKADFADTVTVREVSAAEKKLVVEAEGSRREIFADESTQLLDGTRRIALGDLAAGSRVVVDASYEGPRATGRLIADRVVVVREPAAQAR